MWFDQGLVDRLDEGGFVPAGMAAVLAEDFQGDIGTDGPPIGDEDADTLAASDSFGDL